MLSCRGGRCRVRRRGVTESSAARNVCEGRGRDERSAESESARAPLLPGDARPLTRQKARSLASPGRSSSWRAGRRLGDAGTSVQGSAALEDAPWGSRLTLRSSGVALLLVRPREEEARTGCATTTEAQNAPASGAVRDGADADIGTATERRPTTTVSATDNYATAAAGLHRGTATVVHSLTRRGRGGDQRLAARRLPRLQQQEGHRGGEDAPTGRRTGKAQTRTPWEAPAAQSLERQGYGVATDGETAAPANHVMTSRNDRTRTPAARERGRGTGPRGTGRFA